MKLNKTEQEMVCQAKGSGFVIVESHISIRQFRAVVSLIKKGIFIMAHQQHYSFYVPSVKSTYRHVAGTEIKAILS